METKGLKLKFLFSGIAVALFISGCSPTTLKAPCPNFGKNCKKTPVNGWRYN